MAEVTDSELVQSIAQGGGEARAAEVLLCRRFAPRARLYGLRHLRDESRASDLVQIVLLGVLEATRAGRVREPEHLSRFVLGVCRNTALRMREIELRSTELSDPELLVSMTSVPERLELAAVMRCVDRLEPRERTILQLSFVEERTADEIARVLSLTAGNVRVVRHRAVASVRRCLDRHAGATP
jgi:RNA polymerase sigma-70 factor (ECF subfamily)